MMATDRAALVCVVVCSDDHSGDCAAKFRSSCALSIESTLLMTRCCAKAIAAISPVPTPLRTACSSARRARRCRRHQPPHTMTTCVHRQTHRYGAHSRHRYVSTPARQRTCRARDVDATDDLREHLQHDGPEVAARCGRRDDVFVTPRGAEQQRHELLHDDGDQLAIAPENPLTSTRTSSRGTSNWYTGRSPMRSAAVRSTSTHARHPRNAPLTQSLQGVTAPLPPRTARTTARSRW